MSIDKPIRELSEDLKYFDIIRSEWDEEHVPLEIKIAALEYWAVSGAEAPGGL
jgi:hypothetical protein